MKLFHVSNFFESASGIIQKLEGHRNRKFPKKKGMKLSALHSYLRFSRRSNEWNVSGMELFFLVVIWTRTYVKLYTNDKIKWTSAACKPFKHFPEDDHLNIILNFTFVGVNVQMIEKIIKKRSNVTTFKILKVLL